MNQSRLIIIANRLPYQFKERDHVVNMIPSSGGLVSAIISYLESGSQNRTHARKAIWIGAADVNKKKFNEVNTTGLNADENFDIHPVFIPDAIRSKFYHGFCNDCIWPLFHYFPSYAKYVPENFQAYKTANEIFLEKIEQVYKPGDLIWIHDYQLMLLPNLVRKKFRDARIGFFLHIPFPSFELFRILPGEWKNQLLKGLLGADLVGFHTKDYVEYFLKSVQQVLNLEVSGCKVKADGRVITADAFPISIDYDKFYSASTSAAALEEKNNFRKKLAGKKIILSVDRLDYSKALINRLESFELFLQNNPGYIGKVTYLLQVVPSRDIITKYKENKQDIERLVSNINGKYGNIELTPILYQYKSVDFNRLMGLYTAADICLITPARDGMNLVAKEFISSRYNQQGVLIISETTGAASELKEAIIVNPSDRNEISEAILTALTMPLDEQVRRNTAMQSRIKGYDIVKWGEDFINQVNFQRSLQDVLKIKELSGEAKNKIVTHYSNSRKRLFLLDYDGTLVPFNKVPANATPGNEVSAIIESLGTGEKNDVVLISGRKKEFLEQWFGKYPVNMIAEHGGYSKLEGKSWAQTINADIAWKTKIMPFLKFYEARCPGSFIEDKHFSLAWHYRNVDREFGLIRAKDLVHELNQLSALYGFQVMEGNMVVEARAKGINKGATTKLWLQSRNYDFILAIGDDKTDEDTFMVLPNGSYSIKVGPEQSLAKYHIKKQTDVIDLLKKFCS